VRLLYRIFLPGVGLVVVSGVIYAGMGGFGGLLAGGDTRPTFFEQFVIAGGPIVWFVLLPLSVVTVFLAVEHFLTIRRKRLLPEGAARSIGMMIARYGLGQFEGEQGRQGRLVSDEERSGGVFSGSGIAFAAEGRVAQFDRECLADGRVVRDGLRDDQAIQYDRLDSGAAGDGATGRRDIDGTCDHFLGSFYSDTGDCDTWGVSKSDRGTGERCGNRGRGHYAGAAARGAGAEGRRGQRWCQGWAGRARRKRWGTPADG